MRFHGQRRTGSDTLNAVLTSPRPDAPKRKAVISRSRVSLQGPGANPACYDCNPILVSSAGAFRECSINFSLLGVSTDCEPRSVKHTFGF